MGHTKRIVIYIGLILIIETLCTSFSWKSNSEEAIKLQPQGKSLTDSELLDKSELTLQEAIDIALEKNKQVQSVKAKLPVIEANLIIAKYFPNPRIGSNAEIVTGGSVHPVELGQTLELGRKRHWRIEVAKKEISKTELEIRKVLWETKVQAHIAYSTFSADLELFNIAKKRLEFYKSLLEIAEKRYSAGDISGLDVDRTKMEVLSAENDLNEFEKKLTKSQIEFNTLLGVSVASNLTPVSPETLKPQIMLEDESIKKAIDGATIKRLEIAILENEFGITRAKLKKARWERIPSLYVEGGPARPSFRDNIWGPYVGAEFELPVFNRKQGEIKEAKAQIGFLEKERNRIELEIQAEVKSAYKNLEVSEKQVKRFEEQLLTYSENILDMIKKGYEIGRLNLTDVLNAEQKNRDLREEYLESLLNYQASLASLEYSVGVSLL